jgi:hypothetical protein
VGILRQWICQVAAATIVNAPKARREDELRFSDLGEPCAIAWQFFLTCFPDWSYGDNRPRLRLRPPRFLAGYRGFSKKRCRKRAPKVPRKFEDVLKKSELGAQEFDFVPIL